MNIAQTKKDVGEVARREKSRRVFIFWSFQARRAAGLMMANETDKALTELRVFRAFAKYAGLAIDLGSVRKGIADIGEPDILCTISNQPAAFELTEACAPEFAAAASAAARAESKVAVA